MGAMESKYKYDSFKHSTDNPINDVRLQLKVRDDQI